MFLNTLGFWNLRFEFKRWSNVEIGWTGPTEDLGAHTVAPRSLWWHGLKWRPRVWFCVAGPVVMIFVLISEFGEFLPRVGQCSDIVLGFDWFYCINFKSRTRNAAEILNLGETGDLGAPVWAPKWFCALGRTSSGAQVLIWCFLVLRLWFEVPDGFKLIEFLIPWLLSIL